MLRTEFWLVLTLAGLGCSEPKANDPVVPEAEAGLPDATLPDATLPDMRPCTGAWQRADNGVSCEPPPLREDCPPGSFALPDGSCTEVWECPENWSRIIDEPPLDEQGQPLRPRLDIGCEPPPLREDCPPGSFALPDGSCTEVWECPDGWRRIVDEPPLDEEGQPVRPRLDIGCEPIYDDCPEGQLPLLGGGCDDLGLNDCGEDTWGDHDWPANTVYVAADAPVEGADGSRERPYPTVNAGLEAAGEGGTVALAAGRYEEQLTLRGDIRLGGRCAERVHLIGGLVPLGAGNVYLHDLSMDGANDLFALRLRAGRLQAERLHVFGGTESAVSIVAEAQAELSRIRVGPSAGYGLSALNGGSLGCTRCRVEETTEVGVVIAQTGSSAVLTEVFVQSTRPHRSGALGWGMSAEFGASLTLSRVRLSDHGECGFNIVGEGTRVQADQLTVQGTRPRAQEGMFGRGVHVHENAHLRLFMALIEANHEFGLLVQGAMAEVQALTVRDTLPRASDHRLGVGVLVSQGDLRLSQALLATNHEHALAVDGVGAVADARHITARDTQIHAEHPNLGSGVAATAGAQLTLSDALLAANGEMGLNLFHAGTLVDARRITVRTTRPNTSDQSGGRAVQLALGAQLKLSDSLIATNREYGIIADGEGTVADLTRIAVRDTQPDVSSQRLGRGLQIQLGARLTLNEVLLSGNHDVGFMGLGAGTVIVARHLTVRDTRPQRADQTFGIGMSVQEGAHIDLSDTLLEYNRTIALLLTGPGSQAKAQRMIVRDTQVQASDGFFGAGIHAQYAVRLELSGGLLASNHAFGLAALDDGTEVELQRVTVRDTQPGEGGRGASLHLQHRSRLNASDLRVLASPGIGLNATSEGVYTLERVLVTDTRAGATGFGDAAVLFDNSRLDASEIVLRNSPRNGLLLSNADAEIGSGLITGNTTGVVRQLEAKLDPHEALLIEGNLDNEVRCETVCFEPPPPIESVDPLE